MKGVVLSVASLKGTANSYAGRWRIAGQLIILVALSLLPAPRAFGMPSYPTVFGGAVGISAWGGTMTINTLYSTCGINWQSFSLAAGATISIQQPSATSRVLLRVTGGTAASIAGSITSNGQVFIVAPGGVTLLPGS